MNSSQAIDRSITMDHTPKHHRGKWNAIETFFTASWCGSAVIGGVLIEGSSIIFNFEITCLLQLFATTCYVPLLCLVKYKKKEDEKENLLVKDDIQEQEKVEKTNEESQSII